MSSIARTALALLCAVSLIYGTALFPAAFDVELATTAPDAPEATDPPEDPARDGDRGDDSSSTTGDGTATATEAATATPSPEPAGADGGGSDSAGGSDGFGVVVGFVVLGLLVVAVAALRDASLGTPSTWSFPSLGGLSLSNLPLPSVGSWLQRIPQLTTWLLVSGGAGLAGVVGDLVAVGRGVAASLTDAAGPSRSLLGSLVFSGPRALAAVAVAPFGAVARVGSLFAGLSFLGGGFSGTTLLGSDPPADDARERAPVDPAPAADEDEPVPSVTAAWEAMASLVTVRNPDATTPAEYARRAIDAGMPAEPVRRLTALFREVRYGGRPESEERLTLARRALDAVTGGDDG